MQTVCVGVTVQLLSGEVRIPVTRQPDALAALKRLDRDRSDLMTGSRRGDDNEPVPHWAFVDSDLQAIGILEAALRAIRFDPVLDRDGNILGVELAGKSRSRGDELHLWSALAPFVESGGRLDWLDETGAVERWRFDGTRLRVVSGALMFEDDERLPG